MISMKLSKGHEKKTTLGWHRIDIVEFNDDHTGAVIVAWDVEKGSKYAKVLHYLDETSIWEDLSMNYEVIKHG